MYSIQDLICSAPSRLSHKCILSRIYSAQHHPVFPINEFYLGSNLLSSIMSFPKIIYIQELLCSAASRLFQKSIISRNCSAQQHNVFSRNLLYPGTALLCSIMSFLGIYSIQELLLLSSILSHF